MKLTLPRYVTKRFNLHKSSVHKCCGQYYTVLHGKEELIIL